MRTIICMFVIISQNPVQAVPPADTKCAWKKNFTDSPEYITKEYVKQIGELENCLFYYLLDKEYEKTGEYNSLITKPPPKEETVKVLPIQIEDVIIHNVQLKPQSSYQFRIQGEIYLNWQDERLTWDVGEWHLEQFTLHDGHHIWAPKLKDYARCADDPSACLTTLNDVDLQSDGRVSARIHFSYDAFCRVDYLRYPEEENKCCIFFSGFEQDTIFGFEILPPEKRDLEQPVGTAAAPHKRLLDHIYTIEDDHSAWVIDEHTVAIETILKQLQERHISTVNVAPFDSLQMLRVCVHAEKKMGTVAFALRLPVTIATMVMLVSPLFGDLRTQAWVKLATLSLQTICFLFLCSIAPPNGFAGTKPRICKSSLSDYKKWWNFQEFKDDKVNQKETHINFHNKYIAALGALDVLSVTLSGTDAFYELLFIITLVSMVVTVGTMALSRVKRNVPPSHRLFLLAKLVNRLVCCIEPEPSVSYQRHMDETEQQRVSGELDYTQDWRHIYMAINNLFAGFCFTMFFFAALAQAL